MTKIYPSTRSNNSVLLILTALFLMLMLVACGGNETPTETTTAVAAPTAPAEEPTEAPEPTAVPPTEVPPTEVPAAEPTAEEAAAFTTLSGECGNAFYPVIEGRTMTYRNTMAGLGESTFVTTYSDVSDSSFTVTSSTGEEELVTITWTCSEEGLLSPNFSGLAGAEEGLTIEFVEATGVTIPTEDMFEPGNSWQTGYVANASMGDAEAGEVMMVQEMDMTNTVTGIEAVSVPAGDFPNAVRVDTTGTINMSFSMGGTAQPGTSIDMTYTSWYVENIGLVRQDFGTLLGDGEGINLTELVSYE